MTLSILAISAISSFTLLAPGGEMVKQTPVSALEGNRIEQRAEVNQNKGITFTMGKQVDERVAVNKPVESRGFASLPQAERTQSATLAVYQDNQGNQGKESPILAINSLHLENGTRIEDKQWSTAYASPERTERTERGLA
jgi:hypothetical protein